MSLESSDSGKLKTVMTSLGSLSLGSPGPQAELPSVQANDELDQDAAGIPSADHPNEEESPVGEGQHASTSTGQTQGDDGHQNVNGDEEGFERDQEKPREENGEDVAQDQGLDQAPVMDQEHDVDEAPVEDQEEGADAEIPPVREPIFGHSSSNDPRPEFGGMCTIKVGERSLGFMKTLISANSIFFYEVLKNGGDECVIPWDVEWQTVCAYLHLISTEQARPTIVQQGLEYEAFASAKEFTTFMGRPSGCIGMDLAQIKILYLLHFHQFSDDREQALKLSTLLLFETAADNIDSSGIPVHDFIELAKVYHFCWMVGSPHLTVKVKQIYLQLLSAFTALYPTYDNFLRVLGTSEDWLMLGNARISQLVQDKFLEHFRPNDQETIRKEWKNIQEGR